MGWFQDNIFYQYFNEYHRRNDSFKNPNFGGKGLLQRFMELIGKDIDERILPPIDNMTDNLLMPDTILPEILPFLESERGVDLDFGNDVEKRKQILKFYFRLSQIKGSERGFEASFRVAGFQGITVETFSVDVDFDNPIAGGDGCNDVCYEYDINITTTKEFLLYWQQVRNFFNLSKWNEPSKTHLRGFIHNDYYLPREYVSFSFGEDDDPNLYCDNQSELNFNAWLDDEGHLIVEGLHDDYYEFDDGYLYNEGHAILNKPTPDKPLPFNSLSPTDITDSGFTANWESHPNTVNYEINVGTDLREDGNVIIDGRFVDTLNVGTDLSYVVSGLNDETPYFYQVFAVMANKKRAISSPQPVFTKKTMGTPVLQEIAQVTGGFIVGWQSGIDGQTAMYFEISDTADFSNILYSGTEQVLTDSFQFLGYAGTIYIRAKSVQNEKYFGVPCQISESDFSNELMIQL